MSAGKYGVMTAPPVRMPYGRGFFFVVELLGKWPQDLWDSELDFRMHARQSGRSELVGVKEVRDRGTPVRTKAGAGSSARNFRIDRPHSRTRPCWLMPTCAVRIIRVSQWS